MPPAAAQRRHDKHDKRVDIEATAHHLGFDEVLQQQVGGQHHQEHDGSERRPPSPPATITARPPPRKAPMYGM